MFSFKLLSGVHIDQNGTHVAGNTVFSTRRLDREPGGERYQFKNEVTPVVEVKTATTDTGTGTKVVIEPELPAKKTTKK